MLRIKVDSEYSFSIKLANEFKELCEEHFARKLILETTAEGIVLFEKEDD